MISRYEIVVYCVIKCRKSGVSKQSGSQNGERRNNGYRNHMELKGMFHPLQKKRLKTL